MGTCRSPTGTVARSANHRMQRSSELGGPHRPFRLSSSWLFPFWKFKLYLKFLVCCALPALFPKICLSVVYSG